MTAELTLTPSVFPYGIGTDTLATKATELRKLFRSWGFNVRLERTENNVISIFIDECWDPLKLELDSYIGQYLLWGFTSIWEQIAGKEDEDQVYQSFIDLEIFNDYHWDLNEGEDY